MYYKICIKYLGPPLTDLRDIFCLTQSPASEPALALVHVSVVLVYLGNYV